MDTPEDKEFNIEDLLPPKLADVRLQEVNVVYDLNTDGCYDIDMTIYLDGEKALTHCAYSWQVETIGVFRHWLECIVLGIGNAMFYWDGEGEPLLKFEYKQQSLIKRAREIGNGVFLDYEDCCKIKLSDMDKTVEFWGKTKEILKAFYESFLKMVVLQALRGGSRHEEFEHYLQMSPIEFYNYFKSVSLEHTLYKAEGAWNRRQIVVKEVIVMFCDYEEIFWSYGIGCGDSGEIHWGPTGAEQAISLSSIPELCAWKDEYIEKFSPKKKFTQEEYEDWYARGLAIAEKVRELLPQELDLWYGGDGWERLTFVPLKKYDWGFYDVS